MLNAYRTTSRPKGNRPPVLLLCQHAGSGNDFLDKCPLLSEHLGVSRETLQRYFAIESDIGSRELVMTIAEHLSAPTLVLDFLLPRGIVDPNRYVDEALHGFFRLDELPELKTALLDAHRRYVEAIDTIFKEIKPELYLDIHTMSPYSLSKPARSDSIEGHIESWLKYRGESRKTDIITRNEDGTLISYAPLVRAVRRALENANVEYDENKPFVGNPHICATKYLVENRGIAIDFSKAQIARSEDAPLDKIEVSMEKVGKIGVSIAREINKILM